MTTNGDICAAFGSSRFSRRRALQLELMDAEIGRLLDHLDNHEISDNTIVVYTTDNGGSTCNFGDNTPLAGTKYTLWEGGIRVPMLIRWPQGRLPVGHSNSSLISTLDLTPTLLAAAGAAPSAWIDSDGIDQTTVLRDDQTASDRVLHWHCGWQWAIRSGDWKLSYVQPDSAEAEKLRVSQHANVGRGYFLANLAIDLGEQHNYLSAEPGIVNRLIEEHTSWCDEVGLDSQTARSADRLASA